MNKYGLDHKKNNGIMFLWSSISRITFFCTSFNFQVGQRKSWLLNGLIRTMVYFGEFFFFPVTTGFTFLHFKVTGHFNKCILHGWQCFDLSYKNVNIKAYKKHLNERKMWTSCSLFKLKILQFFMSCHTSNSVL